MPQPHDLPGLVHALVYRMLDQLDSLTSARGKAELHPLAPICVLHEYAKLGAVQRGHLVGLRVPQVLSQLAVTMLGTYSPPRLDSFGAVGYALHSILALLVRGTVRCAHVSLALRTRMRMRLRLLTAHARALRSQGGPCFSPQRGAWTPNPYALPGGAGVPPLNKTLYQEWYRPFYERYIPLLVEAACAMPDARELLCYLCWDNMHATRLVMQHLLTELHHMGGDDALLAGLLQAAELLLAMGDALAPVRAALFVNGRFASADASLMPDLGFMDALGSRLAPWAKRWILARWAMSMHDSGNAGPLFIRRIVETMGGQWVVRGVLDCSCARLLG